MGDCPLDRKPFSQTDIIQKKTQPIIIIPKGPLKPSYIYSIPPFPRMTLLKTVDLPSSESVPFTKPGVCTEVGEAAVGGAASPAGASTEYGVP